VKVVCCVDAGDGDRRVREVKPGAIIIQVQLMPPLSFLAGTN
jgi:hypothetical protein